MRDQREDEATCCYADYDFPLKPGMPRANFRTYTVTGGKLHVITVNLNVNPNLRVVPYYDGNARRVESTWSKKNIVSWKDRHGQNALAIVSGTFFDYHGVGVTKRIPFGDVISPSGNFSITQIPYPSIKAKLQKSCRCYLAFLTSEKRYYIGYRVPGSTNFSWLEIYSLLYDYLIGGGEWLVFRGQKADHVCRADPGTAFTIDHWRTKNIRSRVRRTSISTERGELSNRSRHQRRRFTNCPYCD